MKRPVSASAYRDAPGNSLVARRAGAALAAGKPTPARGVGGSFLSTDAEALRNELKDTRITVTALQPGPTDTNFFTRAGMQDTNVGADKKDDPADVQSTMGAGDPRQGHRRHGPEALRARLGIQGQGRDREANA